MGGDDMGGKQSMKEQGRERGSEDDEVGVQTVQFRPFVLRKNRITLLSTHATATLFTMPLLRPLRPPRIR